MKKLPRFKSQEEEAEYWMSHDTSDFWDAFEDIQTPAEVQPKLLSEIRHRHEKSKAISIRLYPSQLRMAKAIANKKHVPYQTILRNLIEEGLLQLARGHPLLKS